VALDIELQGERGNLLAPRVGDSWNLLSAILPDYRDESYPLLRHIDRYGNTIFNQSQVEAALPELARLRERATSDEQREIIDSVRTLMEICVRSLHTYIKFIGD
jgi:hypothetical protein